MNLLDRIAYDTGGYTVQEILSSFCKKILEIIDLVNKNEEVCNEVNTIIENIRNEVVPDLVDDIIKEMQDNGYFDNLVNDTLYEQLRTELTTLLNQTITDYTTRLDNFDTQLEQIKSEVNLGCVLRPTTDINIPWELFQDDAHKSVGIVSSMYNSNDGTISLTFDKTYKKIVSFHTFNDEMMKMYGLEVGASTGLASAKLFLISKLIVGTSLTFSQANQTIAISKAGHIESAKWVSGSGVVVKFKNVPKQTPNSVQVTVTNALNLTANCSITGDREITIKFYKNDGSLVTDISGNWACMIDANFTGLVDFNCTSVYDSNILSSMALMYGVQMIQ